MMKKGHILHWAMGVVMTPLLGSCAADDIDDAGGTHENRPSGNGHRQNTAAMVHHGNRFRR